MAKANSSSKRKANWYQRGLKDARKYWAHALEEPRAHHISGWLHVGMEEAEKESKARPKKEGWESSDYLSGLADGLQTGIESLVFQNLRAAVLAVRKGVGHG